MIKQITVVAVLFLVSVSQVFALEDSRIRTLVYDENEVYKITTHFGYQSNIEFAKGEEIQTISVGDHAAWQIVPSKNFLFIKALETNGHTNMTVLTNKRNYQFDLKSTNASGKKDPTLTYVVRFHYPEAEKPVATLLPSEPMTVSMAAPSVPVISSPVTPPLGQQKYYNFNYTLSGPDDVAPVKVFDDGRRTYFQFTGSRPVQILRADSRGIETPLATSRVGEYVTVDSISPKLVVRSSGKAVKVYNEAMVGVN